MVRFSGAFEVSFAIFESFAIVETTQRVLARSFVCRFASFHSLSEKREKLQTVRPQGAARGVGLVGILITGNAYRIE